MTTAGNIAFVVTLAASLTANVALLVSPGPLSEEREDRRATTEPRLASTRRPVLLPPPAVPAPSAPQIIDCQKRLADLNARRAELKRRVENLATAKQSFDEASPGARNAALEAELRKRVRLDGRNDWLPSGVECRGLVCLVQNEADASTGPVLEREWSRRNLQDAVATRSGTYFRIRDDSVPAGVDIVERFVDDFRRSGAIEGCTARFRDEGKLFVQLNLGAEDDPLNELPPGLSLRMPNGALADTPLGMCIIQALRDAFGRASLPPVHTSVVGYPVVFPQ